MFLLVILLHRLYVCVVHIYLFYTALLKFYIHFEFYQDFLFSIFLLPHNYEVIHIYFQLPNIYHSRIKIRKQEREKENLNLLFSNCFEQTKIRIIDKINFFWLVLKNFASAGKFLKCFEFGNVRYGQSVKVIGFSTYWHYTC